MDEIISSTLLNDYFSYRGEKGVQQTHSGKQQTKFSVQSLNEFVSRCYPGITFRDLRPFHIKKFIEFLKEEKQLKESSISGRLNQLRSFFLFCQEMDLIDKDPLLGIESPMIPIEKAPCITQSEWTKIISKVEESPTRESDTHRAYRDMCMMNFVAYTACSLDEICALTVDDIDLKEGLANFAGTNKSEPRVVPLPKDLVEMLKNYLENHRDTYIRAKSNNPRAFFQSSKSTFQRAVRVFSELAVGKRYTVEDIRASRINALLGSVPSVWTVSEFLGIHDLTRLRRYIPGVSLSEAKEFKIIQDIGLALPQTEVFYLKSFFKRKINRNLRRI